MKKNKDFQYIYFIENHIISETSNIIVSHHYAETIELEIVEDKIHEYYKNFKYIIYRFKIFTSKLLSKLKEKKKLEIIFKLKNSAGNIFENKIIITDFYRDIFIYDFKFKELKGWFKTIKPPISINFNHTQQFEIYLDYIRKKLKLLQNTKENEDFIFSTQKLLIGESKKYEFSFYLMIFLECYSTKYIRLFLKLFKPKKIDKIGGLSPKKIKLITNLFEVFERNPNKILNKIQQKEKDEYSNCLFGIILYFNYNYKKEGIQRLLNNDNIKPFIFRALINYRNLFKNSHLINKYHDIDIDRLIHETGLSLSKNHKLQNIEILNFIQKDVYYNDSSNYGKKIYRPLDILNGLDIKSFNDEFYLEWRKIDWNKIFEDQYFDGFLVRVANLIDNLDNFKILFKLFDISKNPNQQDFNLYSLVTMQKNILI